MNQRKSLYISIAMALLSIIMVGSYLHRREAELLDMSHPLPVLVATRDILKNNVIEEDMLEVREIPKRFVQPGALKNPLDAVGRLASSPIMAGEQVAGTKLLSFGEETGLAVKIPAGMRAVSINIDENSGVGGLIKPDNYVDVIGTFNFGDQSKDSYLTSTIFQDVRVLAVSHDLGAARAKAAGDTGSSNSNKTTITLALDPQQAQDVILAQQSGELYLSLRSLSESEKTFNLKPSTAFSLTGLQEKTTQRPAAYRQYRGH